jgi:hypothetical protein
LWRGIAWERRYAAFSRSVKELVTAEPAKVLRFDEFTGLVGAEQDLMRQLPFVWGTFL